jgi:hypothetical protein
MNKFIDARQDKTNIVNKDYKNQKISTEEYFEEMEKIEQIYNLRDID